MSSQTGLAIYKGVDDALHEIEKLFALVAAFFIFALMVLGVAQIVGRRFFDTPVYGYIDMVELVMTTFAFLGIAYAERIGGHVRMALLVDRLQGRTRWLFEFLGTLIALFVVVVLVRYSFDHGMRAFNTGDNTIDAEFLWWPSKFLVSVALSILSLRLLHMCIGYVRLILWPDAERFGIPRPIEAVEEARREARDTEVSEGH